MTDLSSLSLDQLSLSLSSNQINATSNDQIDLLIASIDAHEDLNDDEMDKMMFDLMNDNVDLGSQSEGFGLTNKGKMAVLRPDAAKCVVEVLEQEGSGDALAALRRWCTAVCVVTFDLDEGPVMEYVYPPIDLSQDELKTIGTGISPIYSTPATEPRHRNSSPAKTISPLPLIENLVPPPPVSIIDTDDYTYAYVYFRQKPDTQIRRGFFQKSLVLLSPHPYHGLFPHILSDILGAKIMDALGTETEEGIGALSRMLLTEFSTDISLWPPPPSLCTQAGRVYENCELDLQVLGTRIRCGVSPSVRFVQYFEEPSTQPTTGHTRSTSDQSTPTKPSNSVQSSDKLSTSTPDRHFLHPKPTQQPQPPLLLTNPGRIYTTFSQCLPLTYLLWELLLLGEPILLQSETPKSCSLVTWTLLELLKPLPFGGDFRPYFTIQDADFKTGVLGGRSVPTGGAVVGVTNLFFEKVFAAWPHKVKIRESPVFFGGGGGAGGGVGGSVSPGFGVGKGSDSPTGQRAPMGRGNLINTGVAPVSPPRNVSPRASTVKAFMSSFRGGNAGEVSRPSISTKHKPIVTRDKKLFKEISDHIASGASPEFLDNLMRRHFVTLTDKFLQPLNRHYETLIVGSPLTMTLSLLRAHPEVKPFQQATFLTTLLQTTPPPLPTTSKKSLLDLYARFLKSRTFASWLSHRSAELNREWRGHYMHVLCESDVEAWGREEGRLEIECVDLLLRVKQEISQYARYFEGGGSGSGSAKGIVSSKDVLNGYIPSWDQFCKLKKQLRAVLALLPESLRMMQ
ncbi:DUF1630-domain-containing protein [Rhizoclosmatium globosum]|uniref:DUF1630-domain-containing protein n=1 Tax=Rhizoclosmatium globosum TaxID=329046 RepID=A0A1Y2B5I8_9FUNG|nr:DUF1630-domain-containing protein [Rhizoclosmatium globosum]|eukprot:ORY30099.1 DUF1630-domain-containing protein [Rhizoclosmatium globosum]